MAPISPRDLLTKTLDEIHNYHSQQPTSPDDFSPTGETPGHLSYITRKLQRHLFTDLFQSIKTIPDQSQLSVLFRGKTYISHSKRLGDEVLSMWEELIKFLWMGAFYLNREDYRIGSLCFTKALERFCDKIWEQEAYKVIALKDILMQLCRYCVKYAKMGDDQQRRLASNEALNSAANAAPTTATSKDCNNALATVLMTLRNKTGRDRAERNISKKVLMLSIINYQFLIYFRIDNVNMCETILIQIKDTNLFYPFKLEDYTMADQVTYNYYAGRVKLFTSEYEEASQKLTDAFRGAPSSSRHNKQLILRNLICVNLMLGKYPPQNLLRKYNMQYYEHLVRACATGDLKTFFTELEKHQNLFMKNGTYLLLERTKIVVYRNFVRKVCRVVHQDKWHFPLESIRIALNMVGMETDEDEVEGIVSNLIFQGYISGYISHSHQKMVTAKGFDKAFPPIRRQFKKLI